MALLKLAPQLGQFIAIVSFVVMIVTFIQYNLKYSLKEYKRQALRLF